MGRIAPHSADSFIYQQTFSKSDGKCLWQDGSLLPLSAALVGDYGDLMPEKERVHLGKQPMLKVEVSRSYALSDARMPTSHAVAGVSIPVFQSELAGTAYPSGRLTPY